MVLQSPLHVAQEGRNAVPGPLARFVGIVPKSFAPESLLSVAKRERQALGWLVAAVCGTYGIVAVARYGFLDDYLLLYQSNTDPQANNLWVIGAGRPVYALLINVFFGKVDNIADFAWLRGLSVMGTALLAAVVASMLLAQRVPRTWALSAGYICVSIPAYQVIVSWSACFTHAFVAVIGVASARVLLAATRQSTPITAVWKSLQAGALLLLALVTYQPAAMAYWWVPAVLVLSPSRVPDAVLRRLALLSALVFGATSVLALLVLRLGVDHYDITGQRAGITTDVTGKAVFFFTDPLPRTLTPWALQPRPGVSLLVGVLILVCVVSTVGCRTHSSLLRLVALAILPILAYLPNLTVVENWASFRTLSALGPLVILYGLMAGQQVVSGIGKAMDVGPGGASPILVVACAVSAIAAVYHVTTYFIQPQTRELRATSIALSDIPLDAPIRVSQSNWFDTTAPAAYYEEFGVPSTAQPWVPVAMVQQVLREQRGRYAEDVKLVSDPVATLLQPQVTLIDFQRLIVSGPDTAVRPATSELTPVFGPAVPN